MTLLNRFFFFYYYLYRRERGKRSSNNGNDVWAVGYLGVDTGGLVGAVVEVRRGALVHVLNRHARYLQYTFYKTSINRDISW